jgi:recombination protein RecR
MSAALERIGECSRCRMLAEQELCWICSAGDRDQTVICAVESPADVIAIEDSGVYRGRYFVLLGRLSPLDGIGPAELGLELFAEQLRDPGIKEVILATSSTVEGEATAGYLASIAIDAGVRVSRIAYGVPIGGELEYVDSGTLSRAIAGRNQLGGE